MAQTLDELRAEVEAEDAATDADSHTDENANLDLDTDEAPQATDEDKKNDADLEKSDDEGEAAEPNPDETDETESELWMNSDDEKPEADANKFTNDDMAGLRKKLQAKADQKLAKKNDEIEQLRADIDALKTQRSSGESELKRPKREDFYESDDPDEAFIDALTDYKIARQKSERMAAEVTTEAQRENEKRQAKIAQGEDDHYTRAATLVAKSKLDPEKYQGADLAFRQAIDEIVPGGGDAITAYMVSTLGEGSEKVVYNVGISKQRLNTIQSLLREDPNGLSLVAHLSDRKNALNNATKRKTSAPAPAPSVNSDVSQDAGEKTMIKQFNSASDSGNTQKMLDILSAGRKKGYKTNSW